MTESCHIREMESKMKHSRKKTQCLVLCLAFIALLLTGGLLCVAGILLGGFAILLSAIGFFVLLAGLNNAYQGYHHHTVEEKQD